MIFPRLERLDEGVAFEDLAPAFVMMLTEVPELLGPDQPDEVKERLCPQASDDAGIRADWEKYVRPELFALLASAREVVTKDLRGLKPSSSPYSLGAWRLEIPGGHVNAWISALNAARLALGTLHGIESEEDLHPTWFPADEEDGGASGDDGEDASEAEEPDEGAAPALDERQIAVAKIHLLGELQAMLILDRNPPPSDAGPGLGGAPPDA